MCAPTPYSSAQLPWYPSRPGKHPVFRPQAVAATPEEYDGYEKKSSMRRKINRLIFRAVVTISMAVLGLIVTDGLLIGSHLRLFCRNAQSQFPGNRVDALIALVQCKSCDRRDRNNAVWALGQLDDQRALPVLEFCYTGNHGEPLDRERLQIALRHLRHQDKNRSEAFLWRWMLPREG